MTTKTPNLDATFEDEDDADDVVDSMRDNFGHQQGGQTAATVDGGYWADNIFFANNYDSNTYPTTTTARRSFLNKLVKSAENNPLPNLRKLAKDLRFHGLDDVCDNVVLAIFAETNARDARPDLSYSFIMRQLRKLDPERAREFQEHFKKAFDEAFLTDIDNVDDAALMQTIQEIELKPEELSSREEPKAIATNREYRLYKLAQNSLGGDITITGRHVADIVKFLLRKISYVNRYHSMLKLREKIWNLDEYQMASKKSPPTASLGQSITFIKTLLNGKDPGYIRGVLSEIVRNLA